MTFEPVTATALIWVVFTFLFTRADTQLEEKFKSLKYSLSINDKGVIDKTQLDVKQLLNIEEINDLGKMIKSDHNNARNIHKFMSAYLEIEKWKKYLELNLLLLSIFVIINTILNNYYLNIFLKIYLISSLILGLAFYYLASKIKSLKFLAFTQNTSA